MEENGQPQTTQPQFKPRKSKAKIISLVILVLLLILAVGGGAYYWQHGQVNDLNTKVGSLQTQLQNASKSTAVPTDKSATFVYAPKTGGLSLSLPKSYGVFISVDGNYGGSPGAEFDITSLTDSNISKKTAIHVSISNGFTTLDEAVNRAKNRLATAGADGSAVDGKYAVTDTKIAGLPAKLVTVGGTDEYHGKVFVYLVGSGSFIYTVTNNGTEPPANALTTVLKGMTIKPTTPL
jgi:hypothetical protein